MLLTVKSNQKTLYRQIGCQFQGKRHIPFSATDHEKRHGRDTVWELRAKEAPEHIRANWPGSAWIVEVITDTLTRKGKRSVRRHLFLTSVRTMPQALLRLIRQRWSIENEWHWARDTQLGEDAHRYANRVGAQGRLKVRHKAAGGGMLVPVLSGLLSSLGPAFCPC